MAEDGEAGRCQVVGSRLGVLLRRSLTWASRSRIIPVSGVWAHGASVALAGRWIYIQCIELLRWIFVCCCRRLWVLGLDIGAVSRQTSQSVLLSLCLVWRLIVSTFWHSAHACGGNM